MNARAFPYLQVPVADGPARSEPIARTVSKQEGRRWQGGGRSNRNRARAEGIDPRDLEPDVRTWSELGNFNVGLEMTRAGTVLCDRMTGQVVFHLIG